MAVAPRLATFTAGTRVKVRTPGTVPPWSVWDDDHQRTSTPVKKRLQQLFFQGDKKIVANVVYIGSESERDRLRVHGQAKVEVRSPSGASVVILAEAANLVPVSMA